MVSYHIYNMLILEVYSKKKEAFLLVRKTEK